MWEAGTTMDDIAAALGITRNNLGVRMAKMRREGWELSYRRAAYAAVPYGSGTWAERLEAMAATRIHTRIPGGWGNVLRRDPCAYCGKPSTDVDHIVARARGGTFGSENLTGACESCNSSKQARPLLAFLILRRIDDERRPWVEVCMR